MSETKGRRIVIGDVHGHYDALMRLIEAIAPGEGDRLYFLGDLIDRGPQSARVVKFVRESSYQCLLGNHEHLLLDVCRNGKINPGAMQGWRYSGGQSTLASYPPLHSNPTQALLNDVEWMRTLPLYLDLGDAWLVHAGVHPQLPLEEQGAEDFCWIREPFHSISQPYFPNKLIIVGHTITFTFQGVKPGQLAKGCGWLGIDTGAYHSLSGWLTGLDITHQQVYQVHVSKHSLRTMRLQDAVATIKPPRRVARR
ncbi:metallophosphoesterase family protein [Phormidium sp. CCY1219]|uniref:metallophosphoesterase family protein n=1 Tax=Phormidium sp. CCY1219 TaxID=2886104 RepID=UPI002D1EF904|nr:metallophosphoesterase family protein [Phormidium sp. CCY1219]MEB3828854.1 serine/threonine protein phosphatase [Phormidium sp. CCY1219]